MELLQISKDYMLPILLFLSAQTVLFITACITIYVRTTTKLKELEVRILQLEKSESKISDKLDEVLEAVHSIDVKLERKADK